MTNQEIYDLIACFDRSTAQTMRLSMQDFAIELTRGGAQAPAVPAAPAAGGVEAAPAPAPGAGETINAPLVGTFYTASSPDSPPFAAVGDRVKKGDFHPLRADLQAGGSAGQSAEKPCDELVLFGCAVPREACELKFLSNSTSDGHRGFRTLV